MGGNLCVFSCFVFVWFIIMQIRASSTFTFWLWPDFTHLIFSCVLGVHKKPPRAAWTRPLPVRLHHPPSTSICKLRFILNLCYLFATHAHQHTRTLYGHSMLWPNWSWRQMSRFMTAFAYQQCVCVCMCEVCVPVCVSRVFELHSLLEAHSKCSSAYLVFHLVSIMQMRRCFQFQFVCLWIATNTN